MSHIEAPVDFKEKFKEVYLQIEALGSRVHWFSRMDEISGLSIDLSEYSGDDLEKIVLSTGFLVEYISMPAIEDDFPKDGLRHNWLDNMSEEINEAYSRNRLRGNKIGLARSGIDLIRRVFAKLGDDRAEECKKMLDESWTLMKQDDQEKLSVNFVDKMAEASLTTLKLLSG